MPRHLISSTQRIPGLSNPIPRQLMVTKLPETNYDKGMFPDIDAASTPNGGLRLAVNSVIRYGKTSRRPGTSIFSPSAPDVNRVLLLKDYTRNTDITNIVRHTKNSVYYLTTTTWNPCAGPALIGSDFDPFSAVVIEDQYFFTNNGKNKIQKLDVSANTYANLGNALEYKKITGFYNRIIAANLQGASPNPVSIAWSGDLNFTQWDSTIDPSAGSVNLVDSSVDLSDHITDIFGFDAVLVILRRKSIWVAIKQPSASDPFNIFCKIPGLGCTCTYGAAKYSNGIVFADLRTKSVYTFSIDGQLTDIGMPIRKALFDTVSDPDTVFASYNPTEAEYSLCVPNELSGFTREWRYNFRSGAWSYNDFQLVSCVSDLDNIAGSRSIDELEGTIDGLLKTINDLSEPIAQLPRRVYGRYDGDIVVETNGSISDYTSDPFTYGGTYVSLWYSKAYENLGDNVYIVQLLFKFRCRTVGRITLDLYRDGVHTFSPTWLDVDSTMLNRVIPFYYKKQIKCDRLQWSIRTGDIDLDLISDAVSICAIPTAG